MLWELLGRACVDGDGVGGSEKVCDEEDADGACAAENEDVHFNYGRAGGGGRRERREKALGLHLRLAGGAAAACGISKTCVNEHHHDDALAPSQSITRVQHSEVSLPYTEVGSVLADDLSCNLY